MSGSDYASITALTDNIKTGPDEVLKKFSAGDLLKEIKIPRNWFDQLGMFLRDGRWTYNQTDRLKYHANSRRYKKTFEGLLKTLYALFSGALDQKLGLSDERKTLMMTELLDGLGACSAGYLGRVQKFVTGLTQITTLDDLIFRFRMNLVGKIAWSLTSDIHWHNDVYQIAATDLEYTVVYSDDAYSGSMSKEQVIIALRKEMSIYEADPNAFLSALIELLQVNVRNYGYEGRKEEGYTYTEFNHISQYLEGFLNLPGDPPLNVDEIYIVDDDYKVYDLNWDRVRGKLIGALIRRGFAKGYTQQDIIDRLPVVDELVRYIKMGNMNGITAFFTDDVSSPSTQFKQIDHFLEYLNPAQAKCFLSEIPLSVQQIYFQDRIRKAGSAEHFETTASKSVLHSYIDSFLNAHYEHLVGTFDFSLNRIFRTRHWGLIHRVLEQFAKRIEKDPDDPVVFEIITQTDFKLILDDILNNDRFITAELISEFCILFENLPVPEQIDCLRCEGATAPGQGHPPSRLVRLIEEKPYLAKRLLEFIKVNMPLEAQMAIIAQVPSFAACPLRAALRDRRSACLTVVLDIIKGFSISERILIFSNTGVLGNNLVAQAASQSSKSQFRSLLSELMKCGDITMVQLLTAKNAVGESALSLALKREAPFRVNLWVLLDELRLDSLGHLFDFSLTRLLTLDDDAQFTLCVIDRLTTAAQRGAHAQIIERFLTNRGENGLSEINNIFSSTEPDLYQKRELLTPLLNSLSEESWRRIISSGTDSAGLLAIAIRCQLPNGMRNIHNAFISLRLETQKAIILGAQPMNLLALALTYDCTEMLGRIIHVVWQMSVDEQQQVFNQVSANNSTTLLMLAAQKAPHHLEKLYRIPLTWPRKDAFELVSAKDEHKETAFKIANKKNAMSGEHVKDLYLRTMPIKQFYNRLKTKRDDNQIYCRVAFDRRYEVLDYYMQKNQPSTPFAAMFRRKSALTHLRVARDVHQMRSSQCSLVKPNSELSGLLSRIVNGDLQKQMNLTKNQQTGRFVNSEQAFESVF